VSKLDLEVATKVLRWPVYAAKPLGPGLSYPYLVKGRNLLLYARPERRPVKWQPTQNRTQALSILDFLLEDEIYHPYKPSLSIEYSGVIDWVVEFCPRRNHPHARDYGHFQRQSVSLSLAICQAACFFVDSLPVTNKE